MSSGPSAFARSCLGVRMHEKRATCYTLAKYYVKALNGLGASLASDLATFVPKSTHHEQLPISLKVKLCKTSWL